MACHICGTELMRAKIIKAIAGFFYVYAGESGIYECRAKGIFRLKGVRPLPGDDVEFEIISEEEKTGHITEVLPRTSYIKRPPAANPDQVLLLMAMKHPDPNYLLLDRYLVSMHQCRLPAVVCFNKADLASEGQMEEIREVYKGAGVPVHFMSLRTGEGVEEAKAFFENHTTVLAGPSGAGKSSLVNTVQNRIHMETGEISKKLARGKNTTRHTELIPINEHSFLFDTPGFTALELEGMEKEELKNAYAEFAPYEGTCFFQGCVHVSEPDCAVINAVREGLISEQRYRQYKVLFEELKEAEKRRYK